jgi:hypothetical protein
MENVVEIGVFGCVCGELGDTFVRLYIFVNQNVFSVHVVHMLALTIRGGPSREMVATMIRIVSFPCQNGAVVCASIRCTCSTPRMRRLFEQVGCPRASAYSNDWATKHGGIHVDKL